MNFICRYHLSESDKASLMKLWNNEYPKNLTYHDVQEFDRYLDTLNNATHYFVLNNDGITGWGFKFDRKEEKWFAIILSAPLHGKGIGSALIDKLKERESELNGWVIDHDREVKNNGKLYRSPMNFYVKNGFRILTDQRIESPNLSAVRIKWESMQSYLP